MVDDTYYNRTQAILVAIFFNYIGWAILNVMDAFGYPNKIRVGYGLSKVILIKI